MKFLFYKKLKFLFTLLFCILRSISYAASVALAWDSSPDEICGYNLCYGTNTALAKQTNEFGEVVFVNIGTYQFTNTVASGTLSNRVEGLDNGRRYFFAVQAFKGGEVSEFSNEVQWSGESRLAVKRKIKMRIRL